jgi:hypothetical protein
MLLKILEVIHNNQIHKDSTPVETVNDIIFQLM